ncbi:hypothetical protein BCR43DRAFT_493915 [Syncephalastrum racemosum]|uniref:Uncharacterized protein n=1 Tax=Syncephalastrum racemosum TaxID=13706 RepID=A0A1X2H747_SYNRA|nr:hypothetical protein BCR43DRAFT_493915 [Syncephalastrum racemosum]
MRLLLSCLALLADVLSNRKSIMISGDIGKTIYQLLSNKFTPGQPAAVITRRSRAARPTIVSHAIPAGGPCCIGE